MSILTDAPCVPNPLHQAPQTPVLSFVNGLFSRRTSSGRVIPAIDGLRSLAILAVIMHHLGGFVALKTPGVELQAARQTVSYRLTNVANYGVQLFFVISGFILAIPFAEHLLRNGKAVGLVQYLKRRASRLHPPYLVNLAVLSLLLWWVKDVAWSEIGPHLLASAFYLHNVIYRSVSTINGVAWTLEIEVQFCLLAPLLAMVYRVRPAGIRRCLTGVFIAAIVLWKWWLGSGVSYPLAGCVIYYLDYFLAGLLLADFYVDSSRRPCDGSVGIAWNLLGLIGMLVSVALVVNETMSVLLPLSLSLICAAALRAPLWNWFFSQRTLAGFGGMCYTTYLYHFGVISLVGRCVAPMTEGCSYTAALGWQTLVILPVILVVSSVLFLLIEKPFMGSRTA